MMTLKYVKYFSKIRKNTYFSYFYVIKIFKKSVYFCEKYEVLVPTWWIAKADWLIFQDAAFVYFSWHFWIKMIIFCFWKYLYFLRKFVIFCKLKNIQLGGGYVFRKKYFKSFINLTTCSYSSENYEINLLFLHIFEKSTTWWLFTLDYSV